MKVEELRDARIGAEMNGMLPALRSEVENMQRAIVNYVMAAVSGGTLTPQIAQEKWLEYVAASRLIQRFEQKARVGNDVGNRLNLTLSSDPATTR